MRHTNLKCLLLVLPLLLPAACGAQATPDYQGEPLLVLTGMLESEVPGPLPEADLVLAWPDFSKGVDGTTSYSTTFARIEVAAQLPARFSAQIFQPPPEGAYEPSPNPAGWTQLGPRSTAAQFVIAKRGVTITDASINWVNLDENQVLPQANQYFLVYYDSDGDMGLRGPDGTVYLGDHVTKGFHLGLVNETRCSMGPDQACLDFLMMFETITDEDRANCTTAGETSATVEIPLDTPLDLVVAGPPAAPSTLPPCPPAPQG
ncbi:MAG TPA: hypothetical protein VGP07_16235 [Polyangia bacterium]|jgi:hypothetical protein